MRSALPRPPDGTTPTDIAVRWLLDYVRSLRPINSDAFEVSHTTRGVIAQHRKTSSTQEETPQEIPEWDDTGWATGDRVVRTTGITGSGSGQYPVTQRDAASSGRELGVWEATEDIPEGTDDEGPSLDSEKWRCVGPMATELFTLYKPEKGAIALNVGRDGEELPYITIEGRVDGGPGGAFLFQLADLPSGVVIKPREVDVCVDGVAKRMWVLGSEPFDPA